jgi:uncharacterized membrane protein
MTVAQPIVGEQRRETPLSLNTRQIVISGVLGAIAIFLGATRLGFIPVPNISGNATIMHIPAILGGVLEGPVVGVLVGGIFGLYSWLDASSPFFKDPSVAVLPRLLIGLVAWAVFAFLRRWNTSMAAAVSGFLGSWTNTVGVVGMIILRGLVPKGMTAGALIAAVLPQAIAESVIATIISVVVVEAVLRYRSGRTLAPEIAPGEEQRY